MAEPRRRVVLTGAAGRIGRAIAPQLADRWDLQLTEPSGGPGHRPAAQVRLERRLRDHRDADLDRHVIEENLNALGSQSET